jgi:inosine-uridine nucleoside N-ribohydrolase
LKRGKLFGLTIGALLYASLACWGQGERMVIIDQDAAGPAGTGQQSILLMIQSPQTRVLGITVVTGDQWRDEEVAHTLLLLELIGRTDIPVLPGAEYPLVRRMATTEMWEKRYGKAGWLGAWTPRLFHPPDVVPPLPEGRPTTKASSEDAAHFLVRMVRKYPHEVTLFEGGPMTNLALAISIDPSFAKLARQLVFMGASLNPQPDDPEFADTPRREFNIWFDPEAAHIVLQAHWVKITCTPVDISIKTHLTPNLVKEIARSQTPAARYVAKYAHAGGSFDYLWDELAAASWLDPGIITLEIVRYMDVDLERGAGYGNILTWTDKDEPQADLQPVHIQMDLNNQRFDQLLVTLLSAPTPRP